MLNKYCLLCEQNGDELVLASHHVKTKLTEYDICQKHYNESATKSAQEKYGLEITELPLLRVTVKWWLQDGRKGYGTDSFEANVNPDEWDIKDLMDAAAESSSDELEVLMPKFAAAHGCADHPEDFGVKKLIVKTIEGKE